MAKQHKIDRYNLGSKVLELRKQFKTTEQIAGILSEKDLKEYGGITQASVSRWLCKQRQERKSQTNVILEEYVKEAISEDLQNFDELKKYLFAVANDSEQPSQIRIKALSEYRKCLTDQIDFAQLQNSENETEEIEIVKGGEEIATILKRIKTSVSEGKDDDSEME